MVKVFELPISVKSDWILMQRNSNQIFLFAPLDLYNTCSTPKVNWTNNKFEVHNLTPGIFSVKFIQLRAGSFVVPYFS